MRNKSFRAAINGGFDIVTLGEPARTTARTGRLDGILRVCFVATCRSSVSFDVGTILTSGANEVLPVYGSAGFIINLGKIVSLLAEPALLGAVGTGANDVCGGAYIALDYGIRFSGENLGVDVTFLEPVAATTGSFDNPFILGYPFVAFTYRTDGDARTPSHASNAIHTRPF